MNCISKSCKCGKSVKSPIIDEYTLSIDPLHLFTKCQGCNKYIEIIMYERNKRYKYYLSD